EDAAAQGRSRARSTVGVHAQRQGPRPAPRLDRASALIPQILERLTGSRLSTGGSVRIAGVRVGIVDVGANTVRPLVAARGGQLLVPVREDRVQLGLGEEIERNGRISSEKLADTAATAAACVRRARKLGSAAVEVLVTSPGRQAENGHDLLSRLAAPTRAPTRGLSAEEEAELARRGAVRAAGDGPSSVPGLDVGGGAVGGGSAKIAGGSPAKGPTWVRSIDIGSLRLTRRAFRDDPPTPGDVARATRAIAEAFDNVKPPRPRGALAVGGTARAL